MFRTKPLKSKTTSSYLALIASAAVLIGCTAQTSDAPADVEPAKIYSKADISDILADPTERSKLIVKVMGDADGGDTHAYLKFHVYGYAGDGNLIPFFTMNNYIVQRWTPTEEPGYFDMKHYEVAYFSEFDTTNPIEDWENPISGEINSIPPFILGPIERVYTPEGVIAPGLGPQPMNIDVIGDRVYIPTQSVDEIPNFLQPEEWGQYSNGPVVYWDSMLTYSADMADVLNPETSRAPAEIHMQNLVSWAPWLELGQRPGRTMVRAFGQHISGPEELDPVVRENLEKYTPDIFDIDEWTELRLDTLEYIQELMEKRDAGELEIEPAGAHLLEDS